MASVITQGCNKCKKCVTVCPTKPFHEDKDTLVIDPEACLDCGVCIPECPLKIIYAQEDLPKNLYGFVEFNLQKSKILPPAE